MRLPWKRPDPAAAAEEVKRRAIALDLGAPLVDLRQPASAPPAVTHRCRGAQDRAGAAEGIPAEHGLKFLDAQRGWIAARLEALPRQVRFAEGAVVPVFGVPHRIRRVDDPEAPPVVIADGEIRVRGEPAHVPRRVRDHLAHLAARELARRARDYAASIDKRVMRVTVRDTKSRWGSCSSTGNLSFSWRLVFAPETVVDYVVAHEVAHLAEMNHGPRFWKLVRSLTPDTATPRAWLKRHRSELLSYG